MMSVDEIKRRIRALYENAPNIHIDVNLTRPRVYLVNEPVVITGVYQHIFQIEERTDGVPKSHTLQYNDVLTNKIHILELQEG